MATVFDVAAFILNNTGAMPAMKLHKLLYYCQAWSLVWDEEPLFNEPIEAWASGAVVRELYDAHQGLFKISKDDLSKGDPTVFTPTQRETIEEVLTSYGKKSTQWLSDLIHNEDPWSLARKGLQPNERGNKVISLASMAEYYSAAASSGVEIY